MLHARAISQLKIDLLLHSAAIHPYLFQQFTCKCIVRQSDVRRHDQRLTISTHACTPLLNTTHTPSFSFFVLHNVHSSQFSAPPKTAIYVLTSAANLRNLSRASSGHRKLGSRLSACARKLVLQPIVRSTKATPVYNGHEPSDQRSSLRRPQAPPPDSTTLRTRLSSELSSANTTFRSSEFHKRLKLRYKRCFKDEQRREWQCDTFEKQKFPQLDGLNTSWDLPAGRIRHRYRESYTVGHRRADTSCG